MTFDGNIAIMLQQNPDFKQTQEAATLARLLGLSAVDLLPNLPEQNLSTGRPNLIVVLKTVEALKTAIFNWPILQEYFPKGDSQSGICLSPP